MGTTATPIDWRQSIEQRSINTIRTLAMVEQASTFGWERYVGLTGAIIAMRTFGASAPLKELQKKFGFTVDNVIAAAREQLKKTKR